MKHKAGMFRLNLNSKVNHPEFISEIDALKRNAQHMMTEVERIVKEAEEHKVEMNKLFKKLDSVIQDRIGLLIANHNLRLIVNDVKRHTDPCADGVGKFIRDRIADFESLPNPEGSPGACAPVHPLVGQAG